MFGIGATLLMLTSCASVNATDPQATIAATPGEEFDLPFGRTAVLTGSPLRVRFTAVLEDSRCPSDVQCVWEGNIKISLLAAADAREQVVVLNGTLEPREATVAGHTIELVRAAPVPRSDKRIEEEEYVARLVIRQ